MKPVVAVLIVMLSAVSARGQGAPAAVADAPNYIDETENFRLYCNARDHDCGAASDPAVTQHSRDLLDNMQAAYGWLGDLGFKVEESHLERGDSDNKFLLRLDPRSEAAGGCAADACTDVSGAASKLLIPKSNIAMAANDPSLLAHEFVHTLQKATHVRDSQRYWMDEATATAIGTSFGTKYGRDIGVYEPQYFMSFDQPFYDVVSEGYGNWAYLLGVGQNLGSRDMVAYLSEPAFLNIEEDFHGKQASAIMELLYDSDLVGGQTFDRAFPKFAATMNNMEPSNDPNESAYHYYTDIEEYTVDIPATDAPHEQRFDGSAMTYAVAPMHLKLDVTAEPDAEPRDTLMMVDLEVVNGSPLDDLTLINEHKQADEPLQETLMLDGSEPPDELGFVRVVNVPSTAQGEATRNAFEIEVRARPISLDPPDCLRAGEPAVFAARGFDPAEAGNWRLDADNGTTKGLSVTPARAGEVTVTLEIDSPVTRGATGIDPVSPKTTRVELGQFNVAEDDCMVRLTLGPAQATYTSDGSYTEYSTPGGRALYFKENDVAIYKQSGWMPIPAQAKKMMIGSISGSPLMGGIIEGPLSENADAKAILPAMPKEFSMRFSWKNIRKATRLSGKTPRRSAAPCPGGGEGCTETVFQMGSYAIPIVYDAQDRPLRMTVKNQLVEFAYGTWPIRRPPGW
ncbi:hypothetical protein [Roseovarius sp. MMSF_3281]|uniref:hypothetical protein n=1 Tax=Roseovarius sp. MMSF_3281 TaxID=3046694 RepID=UPI00273EFD26|nr:hypothetical protein [Roseovarius sp. MMSF_3281]